MVTVAVTDYTESLNTIDAAYQAGIRYFDTAPFYGRGRSRSSLRSGARRQTSQQFCLVIQMSRLLVEDKANPGFGIWMASHTEARFDMSRDGILRAMMQASNAINRSYRHFVPARSDGKPAGRGWRPPCQQWWS